MDIRRAFFNGFAEHGINEFNNGRVVFAVEQIFGVRQFFSERE